MVCKILSENSFQRSGRGIWKKYASNCRFLYREKRGESEMAEGWSFTDADRDIQPQNEREDGFGQREST